MILKKKQNQKSMQNYQEGKELTLYSIVTPFDTFEISCIWKYYG